MKIRIIRIPDQYKYGGELNARKWKHADGGSLIDDINNNPISTAVKFLDPTGITSWYDVYNAGKDMYYNPSLANAGALGLELFGAIPLVGKAGKVVKGATKLGTKLMTKSAVKEFGKDFVSKYGLDPVHEIGATLIDQSIVRTPGLIKDSYDYRPNEKAEGGPLLTHGGIWSNGVTTINNGDTHEQNPYEGVQMGTDPQGVPNLVEEGEVVFNDYVFSNRLLATGGLLAAHNLPTTYANHSFADIAKELNKESEERPNDPISKRGLMSSMTRLQQAQEQVRIEENKGNNKYSHGGKMGILFDGLGSTPNVLDGVNYSDWRDYGTLLEPVNAEDLWNESLVDADENDGEGGSSKLTWLRYAPVIGSAIGLGQNLLSKPDYTGAETILEAANQAGNYIPIDYTPIGNYLQYKPFDRNFYLNKLNAQAGAARRAIMNTSSPSRNAALLAADYNAQGKLGDLARQAEEYNLAQRQAVENFNRGTNMANSEMDLKAAMSNQMAALKARSSKLSGIAQAMSMRDAIDSRRGASMSANLTNFFNSLGDIGREEYSRNMIMSNPALYYSIDRKGNITYKNGYKDLSEAEKKEVRSAANKAKNKKAKGGYLTIKKGGRHE